MVYLHIDMIDQSTYMYMYMYRSVPGKFPWALNHRLSFFTILGVYSIKIEIGRSIFMGMELARYTHMPCTLYIEHARTTF